jgi:hypothetical protein
MTRADRLALCAAKVTLNGNPAKVSGVSEPFAHVTDLTTRLGAVWPWPAVARIVAKGGAFTS